MGFSKRNRGQDEELTQLKEENEKLNKKLKKRDEKIQRYKEELVNNSVIERWKIGEYLHDNLAQKLTSAKISINLLKDELSKENLEDTCEEIIDLIDESIEEVRDLSHDIIPLSVETEGVGKAFKHLQRQAEKQHGVKCILETQETILDKINSRKVATNLYNITQEAIKNAVNHGEAKNIKIALIEHNEQLYLHVKDDGKGFEPANEKRGMGLTIMKHRAEEMDGWFRIKKSKEDSKYSTLVTCSLPLEAIKGD